MAASNGENRFYHPQQNEDIIDRMLHRKDRSWVNFAILGANLLMFVLLEINGGSTDPQVLLDWGASYTPLIEQGEYYRLFTCMFLHSGLWHLGSNMILLFFMGDYMERYLGRIRYLILYLGGGMLSSIFSCAVEAARGEKVLSVGASGAIFALMAGLLLLVILHRGKLEDLTLTRVLILCVLSLLVGFQSEGVDAMGHLGGFLGGLLISAILLLPEIWRRKRV